MPKLKNRLPAYRRHKATGQAVVTLNGKDHYLGKYGTKASRDEYDRLTREWLENGRTLPGPGVTVNRLVIAYMGFARSYYRSSGELNAIKCAVSPLKRLYGRTPAAEFGPLKLRSVRTEMIRKGWTRRSINIHVGRVKRVFKWGVEHELIPPSVYHGLQALSGVRRGREGVKESVPVKPVSEHEVEAILPHVSTQVAAMVQLQWLTGMRPGEVTTMRMRDLDRLGRLWIYSPIEHKTAIHGHQRRIYLGPKAQEILQPFVKLDPDLFLFSASEAEGDRRARLHARRKTPLSCGNRPGTNRRRKPKHQPRNRYHVDSYRRAIHRGCKHAGIAQWSPHRLRHAAGTRFRKEYGLDVARAILGHTTPVVTEIYAELDGAKAAAVMEKIG